MNKHERRVRDACLAWDGTSLDDRDLSECVRVGDIRTLLGDLDAARASIDLWKERAQNHDNFRDALSAKLARAEGLLRQLRGWDVMHSSHDGVYWRGEIDAYFAASDKEPRT